MYIDKLPEDKHAYLCCPHGIGTVSHPLNVVYHIVEIIVIFLYSLKLFLLILSFIFSACTVVIRIPQPGISVSSTLLKIILWGVMLSA